MKAVSVKEAVSVSTPLPTKVKFVLGHRCAKWIRINWIVDKLYLNQGRQTHFFHWLVYNTSTLMQQALRSNIMV